MLTALSKAAGGWVAKTFLAVLIMSFAVWGFADTFSGYGRRTLVSVGSQDISVPEYERAYQHQLTLYRSRRGRPLTSAEARALNLQQQVLSTLIAWAAIDLHAKKLNLGITDDAIKQSILRDPTFYDRSGRFSRRDFLQTIREHGLSEQAYVAEERRNNVRRQVLSTLAEATEIPRALLEAVNRFRGEQRTLKYFILPAAGAAAEPAEEQLKSFYEGHKPQFTAPEYRKIGVLTATLDAIKQRMSVQDADVKAAYDAQIETYRTPEKRSIQQIAFPNAGAAKPAWERLKKGADFLEIAKEQGFKPSDIELGTLAQKAVSDKKIAEAAFGLAKDQFSEPVEGTFSTVIVRVTGITPATEKSLDAVKDKIRDELATVKAKQELSAIVNSIEDERAAGASLSQAAKKLNLSYTEAVIDRRGEAPGGGKPEGLPEKSDLVAKAFEAAAGVESDPVQLPGQGQAWFDVLEIIRPKLRPFEDIKDEVKQAWQDDDLRARLTKKAGELVAGGQGLEAFNAAAKSVSAEVKTSKPLKRSETEAELPRAIIAQAFALPEGASGWALTNDRKGAIVFAVEAITPPPPLDEKQSAELRKQLGQALAGDMVAQYVSALQNTYGVRINQQALSTVTGQQQQ